jgi:hypothetical protein
VADHWHASAVAIVASKIPPLPATDRDAGDKEYEQLGLVGLSAHACVSASATTSSRPVQM